MNGLVIVLIAIVVLGAGYLLYGRWLANKWGLDPKAKTPAYTHEDGQDYVPSSKLTCHRTDPGIRIRLGAGIVMAADRRSVFRSRAGFRCTVCFR